MKLIFSLIITCFLISSGSCTYPCQDTTVGPIWITNPNNINDTIITIKRYVAGSNFTNFKDSTIVFRSKGFSYVFTIGSEYLLTVYPVGKAHQLKNIHKGNEKKSGGRNRDSDICHFSVSYVIDDSVINIPKQFGGTAYAWVYITN